MHFPLVSQQWRETVPDPGTRLRFMSWLKHMGSLMHEWAPSLEWCGALHNWPVWGHGSPGHDTNSRNYSSLTSLIIDCKLKVCFLLLLLLQEPPLTWSFLISSYFPDHQFDFSVLLQSLVFPGICASINYLSFFFEAVATLNHSFHTIFITHTAY